MANRLPTTTNPVSSMSWAPSGPGVVLFKVSDFSPDGLKAAARGDESKGINAGMLTGAPEITVDPDTQNYLDNVSGLTALYKGAQQPGTYNIEVSCEMAELNHRTIYLLQPGLSRVDWDSDVHASLAVGTGESRFSLTAREASTPGNSITLTITVPAGASANPSGPVVTVTGDAITVDVSTADAGVSSSTAFDVVEAINAHAGASALVQAGLSLASGQISNQGTGLVSAQASTPLAGGAAGSRVGYQYTQTGFFNDSDYISNVTMVLPTTFQDIYYVCVIENAINSAEWNPSYDEDGAVAGVGVTWVGHSTAESRDPVTGAIRPPVRQYLMDAAVSV